jgi:hypothetical protein
MAGFGSAPGEHRGGRQKGTPNKTTALLKDAILKAAEAAGGGGEDGLVNYLTTQATETPTAFMSLLGKVLPMQLVGDEENPVQHLVKIERVIVRPPDRDA